MGHFHLIQFQDMGTPVRRTVKQHKVSNTFSLIQGSAMNKTKTKTKDMRYFELNTDGSCLDIQQQVLSFV